MLTAILARKAVAFTLGALLGAVSTHVILLATKSEQTVDDSANGNNLDKADPKVTWTSSAPPQVPSTVELSQKVRFLCLIMTHPGNYRTKAVAVNNTWANRCDQYAFVGSKASELSMPLLPLNLTDTYNNLWQKTWMSLDAAEKLFNLNNFDFVLKADDDTYVVVENLRLLLAPLDPNRAVHLGRWFYYDRDPKQSYMSGGGGYILSRAAVKLFLERAVRAAAAPKACNLQEHTAEDWMMGTCLTSLGVTLIDSRDSSGLDRFHPINIEYMIGWGPAEMPPWMWRVNYYKFKACLQKCVSSVSATFHYTNNMYLMEFLLYGIRPIGVDPTKKQLQAQLRRLH